MRFISGSLLLLALFTPVDEPGRQPLASHVESLAYLYFARAAQVEGTVKVEIEIDHGGKVSSASAISGIQH